MDDFRENRYGMGGFEGCSYGDTKIQEGRKHMSNTGKEDIVTYICGIWSQLLEIPHINPSEDFFALGGDSLLAIRVLALINKEYDLDLAVDVFFESDFTANGLASLAFDAVREKGKVVLIGGVD